jgi:hypothetical protein
MCQRLYIASKAELPRIRRSSKQPSLQVKLLDDIDAAVRRQFRRGFDHFSVAGAHLSCGCGFPELPSDPSDKVRPIPIEDRRSVERLREYLSKVVTKHRPVQLYLCMPGDEHDRPRNDREIALAEFDNPEFRFRRLELLTVRR